MELSRSVQIIDSVLARCEKLGITISKPGKLLIQEACERLWQLQDPINGLEHSLNITKSFFAFLQNNQSFIQEIDCESVLLSAFWHDIWKVGERSKSIVWIFKNIIEGRLSAKIFKREAQRLGLNNELVERVCYIISKHSFFNWFRKGRESKLFHDFDLLDGRNKDRLVKKKRVFRGKLLSLVYAVFGCIPQRYYFPEIEKLKEFEWKD